VLARFPGAEVVDVRQGAPAGAEVAPEPPLAEEDAYGADWQGDELDDDS
jgi:hypothetical protein